MTSVVAQLDAVLADVTRGRPTEQSVPGVVALVTDSNGVVYQGAAGLRSLAHTQPMTPDTVFAMYSCTKAITGTTVLQCVEEGLVDLDAPAATYVPELGELLVIEGFGPDGEPRLRAPKRDLTTRMLLLHTAGFGYPYFSDTYHRLCAERRYPRPCNGTRKSLIGPLLFDPGERWLYGINVDWAGLVVQSVRGQRLGEVMAERVFAPLGMSDSAYVLRPDMRARLATIHQRQPDGGLVPTDIVSPQNPEIDMGGTGLYATAGDYAAFLRMWLNDGAGIHGRVLRRETVREAVRSGLGELQVTALPGVEPKVTNDAEFFPGQRKSWAYTFMVNDEQAPTGRPAGALGWAGLANLYYWMDRSNGVAGFWAAQVLPFIDAVALDAYLAFEAATYRNLVAVGS